MYFSLRFLDDEIRQILGACQILSEINGIIGCDLYFRHVLHRSTVHRRLKTEPRRFERRSEREQSIGGKEEEEEEEEKKKKRALFLFSRSPSAF